MIDFLHKHPLIVASVAAIVLLFSAWGIFRSAKPAAKIESWPNAYYFDLTSGKTFVATIDRVPPIPAPSGEAPDGQPAGVWAAVFSCGSCTDTSTHFVGWLEKFSPETQKQLVDLITPRQKGFADFNPYETRNLWDTTGHLLASADAPTEWVQIEDEAAEAIQASVVKKCQSARPTRCLPP